MCIFNQYNLSINPPISIYKNAVKLLNFKRMEIFFLYIILPPHSKFVVLCVSLEKVFQTYEYFCKAL